MTEDLLVETWRDPSRTVEERVEALLAEMTLPEKVAQLGSIWLGFDQAGGEVAPMQNVFSRATSFAEATSDGLGQLTRVFGTAPITPEAGVRRVHELQRSVMSTSRLGIPAIVHEECLTGIHHLPGDGLPRVAGVGGHLRSRAGAGDGRSNRPRHGRRRCPPGTLAGARRGPRLPVGTGRGDPG